MASNRCGFSITELSIVLVVISLLVASVMSGVALKRQALLLSAVYDLDQIRSSINNFKLQYNAWPGDITNATTLWPNGSTANGNGDRFFSGAGSGCSNQETVRAWQHLALANLYPGDFTGVSNSSAPCTTIGTNVPGSKIIPGLYFLWSLSASGCNNSVFSIYNINFIHFGSYTSASTNTAMGAIITPLDGQMIDHKADDGAANTGKIYGVDADGVTGCSANYSSATGANYNIGNTNVVCRLIAWLDNY